MTRKMHMYNNDRQTELLKWFSDTRIADVPEVGGKNASLGEMIHHLTPKGIRIPDGFATTASAFRSFVEANRLAPLIREKLSDYESGHCDLETAGHAIRQAILKADFQPDLAEAIRTAYRQLSDEYEMEQADVAVRSSATAEDLPVASFAGQQETYLNIRGEEDLLKACQKCFASLFTNRAIAYREKKGFDHLQVALSVGVQKMIRADSSCSGVMFTVDTETGFPNAIVINGAWGLGENVVKGTVNPDQFYVFKPHLKRGIQGNQDRQENRDIENKPVKPILEKVLGSKELKMVYTTDEGLVTKNLPTALADRDRFVLSDEEVVELARWGLIIEEHYDKPMDIEWVRDDTSGELYIVQARPETVHSGQTNGLFRSWRLTQAPPEPLVTGLSIGSTIVTGRVKIVHDTTDLRGIDKETILVTEMTEPDWVPALREAAGIVTNFGGRTCHAAIVSRELGIPAIVGSGRATALLKEGDEITLSCAEGDAGKIYPGRLSYDVEETDLGELPTPRVRIMLNLATPEAAFKWWKVPARGVGLARMEFIISNHIKVHPMALVHPESIQSEEVFRKIRKLARGYSDFRQYFVDRLASGIAKIAASRYPDPVIVRTSDFKTNEYAGLIGGDRFEPKEENPMLGWRGASRYYSDGYREGFALECRALVKVREEIGLDNVIVMIPFCRTLDEAEKVLDVLAENGLERGVNGLQVYMMCEVPSNYILAQEFARYFDGFSIGSNDLTQLILGVDRDSGSLAHLFDEDDPAVKIAIREVIERAHGADTPVGFCGQAPSDDSDYARFLVEAGIDSISVVPDSVIDVIRKVSEAELKKALME